MSPGVLLHAIETPREGDEVVREVVTVRGWVLCDVGPATQVAVTVDGQEWATAQLGIPRSYPNKLIERADALVSGFAAQIDLSQQPPERREARIALTVDTIEGRRCELRSITVRLKQPALVRAVPAGRLFSGSHGRFVSNYARRRGEIRLLVFTHDLGLGGGQLYLFELLRLLSQRPRFSATVNSMRDGALRAATEALGIRVHITGFHPVKTVDEYESRQALLADRVGSAGFNVVLANTLLTFPGVDLAARLGMPAVWAIHESFTLREFWAVGYSSADTVDASVKAHCGSAFSSSAAVVFEADATRELFTGLADPRRLVTLSYGIDTDTIDQYRVSVSQAEARRSLGVEPESTLLLCVGTFEPRKAQVPLVEAFGLVASDFPEACLVLVGARDDMLSDAVRSYVRRSGLDNRVRIETITPDLYPWYRAADALICASDVESLPRSVLEAMAFETPVVATNVFGIPELIDNGVSGFLFRPRDIAALANALRDFLRTPASRQRVIAVNGARLVHEYYDSRAYAEKYEWLLRGLVQDPGALPKALLDAQPQTNCDPSSFPCVRNHGPSAGRLRN